ncbi:3-phenylpropionate/cinnamic acid dioxygenase subunit beta [Rhodococcus sp. KBS0724]|uniref:aromatic-ring-hydroxylating dioxygenase subunit beta n=1 Tax=Rhodococcus sp. KBS0724 TaxID=1179674 RepID=UPI0021B09D58|nr:3-phenylpropionate/cinnamic acid dioxygenase subunit beta [Rhodococcus sp. KBS0724]
MTLETTPVDPDVEVRDVLRQYEIEQFYYKEAALLDGHRYDEWIKLFADDVHYFMPIRRTMTRRQIGREFTQPGEMAYFDENKQQLQTRVDKLSTGTAWAEDPPSRTRHLITNIRVEDAGGFELLAHSNFHLYRTRLKSEIDEWVGRREDVLRRVDGQLKIAKRFVYLDQTILQSANLSNFF